MKNGAGAEGRVWGCKTGMDGRYKRLVDLVELTGLLQTRASGLCVEQIAERFEVSRRTAERMLAALRDRFPGLEAEYRDGQKYWRLRCTSDAGPLELPEELEALSRRVVELEAEAQKRLGGVETRHEFIVAIVRSIRDPLAALLAATEAARASGGDSGDAIRRIAKLADRASRIVDKTLQLLERDDMKRDPISTRSLLNALEEQIGDSGDSGTRAAIESRIDPGGTVGGN